MKPVTVQYHFRQRFPYPAERAFRWCLDFHKDDLRLEGTDGERKVVTVAADLLLLTDSFPLGRAGRLTKRKLVRIRAAEHAWTSTHLSGPHRHSQFWYRIVPDGRSRCHLDFTGLHVEPTRSQSTDSGLRRLGDRLAREDAEAWRALARAMRRDLG